MLDLEKDFSEIAALFGDKSRAIMLWNLLDGRAYTATELANCANISPQSASNHLSKFLQKGVLSVAKQGRHRYYKISNSEVAQVVESMAGLLSLNHNYKKISKPKNTTFTYARTCYKHLAGEVGVKITKALLLNDIICLKKNQFVITDTGRHWFIDFGIDVNKLKLQKRSFAHKCLDWSEREFHLAGALGDAFLEKMILKDWFRKQNNTRELALTYLGKKQLKKFLNLDL